MEQPKPALSLTPLTTKRAKFTEAVLPAADDRPELLVGFVLHVYGFPHHRVFTAKGNLYNMHMTEPEAVEDLRKLASRLLAQQDEDAGHGE